MTSISAHASHIPTWSGADPAELALTEAGLRKTRGGSHFHFVPTSSSRLNLAERLFSELEQRQLKRLAVTSVAELEAAINGYLEDRNQDPRPYMWTASAEAIIEKVQRGNETLATLH